MHTLGFIPARGGSKRVPGKNKRLLSGKPLICWTIEAALDAQTLDHIVVSSDDEEILEITQDYPQVQAMPRPEELAQDKSLVVDSVRHALAEVEASGDHMFDAIALIQVSSPLTLAEDIDATVQLLQQTKADTAVSVMQLDHAIYPPKLKYLEGNRLIPYWQEEGGRTAAHQMPTLYVRNGSIYVTQRHVIEQGQIIGEDCRGYVMPRERSIDINEEIDMQFVDFMMNNKMLA